MHLARGCFKTLVTGIFATCLLTWAGEAWGLGNYGPVDIGAHDPRVWSDSSLHGVKANDIERDCRFHDVIFPGYPIKHTDYDHWNNRKSRWFWIPHRFFYFSFVKDDNRIFTNTVIRKQCLSHCVGNFFCYFSAREKFFPSSGFILTNIYYISVNIYVKCRGFPDILDIYGNSALCPNMFKGEFPNDFRSRYFYPCPIFLRKNLPSFIEASPNEIYAKQTDYKAEYTNAHSSIKHPESVSGYILLCLQILLGTLCVPIGAYYALKAVPKLIEDNDIVAAFLKLAFYGGMASIGGVFAVNGLLNI